MIFTAIWTAHSPTTKPTLFISLPHYAPTYFFSEQTIFLQRGGVGRTDTIILMTIVPLKPYIGLLSIPRDLWVQIPGVGEQRINTAYFFAEAATQGSGAKAAMDTVQVNFDVPVSYFVLIRMHGLVAVVDALDGVTVQIKAPVSGYPAGTHHLNSSDALQFARERNSGDDFSRMYRTQILLSGVIRKLIEPTSWVHLPQIISAFSQGVDTNIPLWQLPRLAFSVIRAFIVGTDSQTITHEMVTPFQTSQGAQVLLPNWDVICPLIKDTFGN